MGAPTLYVTKSVEFAAAHRLYREDWSEAKNAEVFGACANPFGHGHNYLLEVTVAGPSDPSTGMVVHFSTLKRILQECVVAPLDHRHMNHDVVFLAGILPTSENLVVILWERLSGALSTSLPSKDLRLHSLRLKSTERNWVDYFGPEGVRK